MEVQFTPEQEARLQQIANDSGTPAEPWYIRPGKTNNFTPISAKPLPKPTEASFSTRKKSKLVSPDLSSRDDCSPGSHPHSSPFTHESKKPRTLLIAVAFARREGTRELVLAPISYMAVYRIKESTIEILQIRHGAQKPFQ